MRRYSKAAAPIRSAGMSSVVPGVREVDVDPTVTAELAGSLVPRDPEALNIDQHMQAVQVVRGLPAEELVVENPEARDAG